MIGLVLIAVLCAAALIMGAFEYAVTATVFTGRSFEEIGSMTGRLYLWQGYLTGFLERPVLGWGFGLGARLGGHFGVFSSTNTHNGFIDAALGTGIIGVMCLVAWMFGQMRALFCSARKAIPGGVGATGAFVMLVVNNNSKTILGGPYDAALVGALLFLGFCHFAILRPGGLTVSLPEGALRTMQTRSLA